MFERGLDGGSAELAALALSPPTSVGEAARPFEAALAEMAVTFPEEDQGELTVLELYLRAMIEGRLTPIVAMNAVYDLYRNEPKARIRHPKRSEDGQKYLGEELGLEYLVGPYFDLLNLTDGSMEPRGGRDRDRDIAEVEATLLDEASILNRYLRELGR